MTVYDAGGGDQLMTLSLTFSRKNSYNRGHNIIGILPKIKGMLSLSPSPFALAHVELDLDFLAAPFLFLIYFESAMFGLF